MERKSKAQAGLEYLMTYGWALILIVTVVAVLWMLIGTPKSNLNFTSSSPTKILVKAGNVAGNNAEIQLLNATGRKISFTGAYPLGYSNCTIDSETTPTTINAGKTMKINCDSPPDGKGCIAMEYTDSDNYEKSVIISSDSTKNCQTQLDPGGPGGIPLEIMDCTDLQEIENKLDAYYALTNDIDCSATTTWNGGTGFIPITAFWGSLDGQGHSITNLYISRLGNGQAMFNYNFGTIKNLSLSGFSISNANKDVALLVLQNVGTIENISANNNLLQSFEAAGGIVEYNNNSGIIRNATANNITINLFRNIGGLVFYNAGLIEDSASNNIIFPVGSHQSVGGLCFFNYGTINNSSSSGTISQGFLTGGFVYQNDSTGIINNSFSTVNITSGDVAIGGFAVTNNGTINSSYSLGNISCAVQCGGFSSINNGTINDSYANGTITAMNGAGFSQFNSGTINRSYSTGLITCACSGGLVLTNNGACPNSFWDTQTSTKATSACGTGKTTAQMKQQATFTGWDFVNTWKINENVDYPREKWQ